MSMMEHHLARFVALANEICGVLPFPSLKSPARIAGNLPKGLKDTLNANIVYYNSANVQCYFPKPPRR